jgi:hypothetical protein
MQRRAALIALLGAAAAVVLIILVSDGGSDEKPSTETLRTAHGERGTRSGSSGTTGSDRSVPGADRRGTARRRARERARRESRAERGRLDQGRLGAQTGGSPVQGGRSESVRPGAAVATIVVVGGSPVGGVQRVRFPKDDRVRLIVRSDSDDVVEIAGYRLTRRVSADSSARFYFETSKQGLFEIRLTRGGQTRIGVLAVG